MDKDTNDTSSTTLTDSIPDDAHGAAAEKPEPQFVVCIYQVGLDPVRLKPANEASALKTTDTIVFSQAHFIEFEDDKGERVLIAPAHIARVVLEVK